MAPEGAGALLDVLLGPDRELCALKQLLIARTEGNPFFLEEGVRALVETGVLLGERGRYRAAKPLTDIQVPATVHSMLAARIDRLPVEDKRLLQCAAVIGSDVPEMLLQEVAGLSDEELRSGLSHLERADFLCETKLFPHVEHSFKHALTQMVTYNSLLVSQREPLHAAIGSALERLYPERADEILERLAHHFGRSHDHTKAVDYALLVAERAQWRWANAEALAHFDAALQRLDKMPDSQENRLRRIDAVLKQAELKFALGRHADHIEALEHIRQLVEQAADPLRRASWYCWTGFLRSLTGAPLDLSVWYCRQAVAIAETAALEELRALAESCLLHVYTISGDLVSAVEVGERALAVFEARATIWWACRTLWNLATAANALGRWQQSLSYCRRALEHAQEVGDQRLRVVSWYRLGSAHVFRGDHEEGLRCYEQALALSPKPFDAAMIKAVQGCALVRAGQIDAGSVQLEEAVAWFDQSHLRYTRCLFTLWLAEAYLCQGASWRARVVLEEVLAATSKLGYLHLEGVAERLFAASLVHEDRVAAAAHGDRALRILDAVGAQNELAKALVTQAELCRLAMDQPAAREMLERALGIFDSLGTLHEPQRVRAKLAAVQTGHPE